MNKAFFFSFLFLFSCSSMTKNESERMPSSEIKNSECFANESLEFCNLQIVGVETAEGSLTEAEIIKLPASGKLLIYNDQFKESYGFDTVFEYHDYPFYQVRNLSNNEILKNYGPFNITRGVCKGEKNLFCVGSEYDNGLGSKDLIVGIRYDKYLLVSTRSQLESVREAKSKIIVTLQFAVRLGDSMGEKVSILNYETMSERFEQKYSKKIAYSEKIAAPIENVARINYPEANDYIPFIKSRLISNATKECSKQFNNSGVFNQKASTMPDLDNKCKFKYNSRLLFNLKDMYHHNSITKSERAVKYVDCENVKWDFVCSHKAVIKEE